LVYFRVIMPMTSVSMLPIKNSQAMVTGDICFPFNDKW
jgi:hypothetical protein